MEVCSQMQARREFFLVWEPTPMAGRHLVPAPSDWEAVAQLRASSEEGAGTSPRVVANYGLHPWRVDERGEGDGWLNSIREHLEADPTAGLGETVSTAAVRSLLQPSSITNFWHPSRDWTS